MAEPIAPEIWATFYGKSPAHRFRKANLGDCFRSLCGTTTALHAQLTEAEGGRRCKRCEKIQNRLSEK